MTVPFSRVSKSHAIGGTYFVLPAVTLADGAASVEIACEILGKRGIYFFRFFVKLFLKGEHRHFHGRYRGMEVHHDARVAFADGFFVVGVAEKGERHTLHAERRLDNVRHVFFVSDGVDIT